MNRKERKALSSLKEEHLLKSIEAVKKADFDKAEQSVDAISIIDSVLEQTKKSSSLIPLLIGLFCLIVIGISATVKVDSTFVRISTKTNLISFKMQDAFIPHNGILNAKEVVITSLGGLSNIYTGDTLKDKEVSKLDLRQGNPISLRLKHIKKDAEVSLNIKDSSYSLWNFRQAQSFIELQADSALLEIDHSSKVFTYLINEPIPELFEIKTTILPQQSTQVELFHASSFSLINMKINEVSFAQENPPRSDKYMSGIQSGNIEVFDKKFKQQLTEGDFIKIKGFKSKRVQILNKKDHYQVILEGTLNSLLVGPEGHMEELKPSLLEYMYNQQFISFLWSALVFLWGLVWSAKKLFTL